MRIGILGTFDNPYITELQRAARTLPDIKQTDVLRFGDLRVGIGSQPIESRTSVVRLSPGDGEVGLPDVPTCETQSPRWDALIVRSMPIGSLEQVIFRMDCLQTWHRRGLAVVNPPRSLEIAIDKWLCLDRLVEHGVAVPQTVGCQTRSAAMEAMEQLGGDVLVKPLFGGEGRGILRVSDRDMAWRVFGTLQQLGQVLYVQQFAEHFGYDIRVLFVGERQFAIRRIAQGDEWRTNLSLGSRAEPHKLTAEQLDVAIAARDAVGGPVVGVDLLPCRDGRLLVLEVNAVPGWKGLAAALDVDIAREIMIYIRDTVRA